MSGVEAVVLDADHTLYSPRAERAYHEKFDFLARETGADRDAIEDAWEAAVEAAVESDDPADRKRAAVVRDALERAGAEASDAVVEEAVDRFWAVVAADLDYSGEVTGMIERLRERYEVLAVASDEFPGPLRMKLATVFDAPERVFDDIVTPRDTGEMKPATEFYRAVLDAHGVEPGAAVAVGDSWSRDLAPAAELGMTTVLVRAESGDPLEPADAEGDPDHVIESILDLEAVLEGLQDGS